MDFLKVNLSALSTQLHEYPYFGSRCIYSSKFQSPQMFQNKRNPKIEDSPPLEDYV